MKHNKGGPNRIGKIAVLALFSVIAAGGILFACDGQGQSDSVGACSTATQCSNFHNGNDCTNAVTVVDFPTGCVAKVNSNCNKPSVVCTTPVSCQWLPDTGACTPGGGNGGTTGNAICPTSKDCG